MYKSDMEIYQYIGQAMFNALPDDWDCAYFVFKMLRVDYSALSEQFYIKGSDVFGFNVDEDEDTETFEAFHELFKMMRENDSDIPWNKARFELMPDGNFDIQFKFDKDFAWLNQVDRDSDAYERLSSDDMHKIKSWEGIPEGFDRYWLK